MAILYDKRPPTACPAIAGFDTIPSIFAPSLAPPLKLRRHADDSGSLLQFTQLFILVVWQGSRPSKLSPNLQVHLSKLPRVHAFALRLEYLKHKASADFSRNLLFVFLQGEQSIALVGFSPTGLVPPRGTLTFSAADRPT